MNNSPVDILGISASPEAGGRTATAVKTILEGAAGAGATTLHLDLADAGVPRVLSAFENADAVVFGSPIFRASYSGLLKELLERTERGRWGEKTAPLQGKAVAIALTGASAHHFLAVAHLRDVLAGFFGLQVLSPGLYFDPKMYVDRTSLEEESRKLALLYGTALAELASAVKHSSALKLIRPQI